MPSMDTFQRIGYSYHKLCIEFFYPESGRHQLKQRLTKADFRIEDL